MSNNRYDDDFRESVARRHLDGDSIASLCDEYGIAKKSVTDWSKEFVDRYIGLPIGEAEDRSAAAHETVEENKRLKKEQEELERERRFRELGGQACEGDRAASYRFIDEHGDELGVRWLLGRLDIYPNAYYSHKRHHGGDYGE